MNKKIIAIGVIGMFLLTGTTAMSTIDRGSTSEIVNLILLGGEPQTELVIEGPTLIEAGYVYYDFYLIEPGECDISLLSIDWGDNWTTNFYGPFESNHIFHLGHTWWEGAGVYTIEAVAHECNDYYAELNVTVLPNEGPDNPTIKKIGAHEFTFTSTDPEGDDITYCIDWDDEGENEWIGPYESGEQAVVSHTWDKSGLYLIRAEAYDSHNAKCPSWGELLVYITRSYSYQNSQGSSQQSTYSIESQTLVGNNILIGTSGSQQPAGSSQSTSI